MSLGQIVGIAWIIAAWWLIASVAAAPFFLLVRAARARGKRLFATEPAARVDALHQDTTNDHIYDA